MRKWRRLVNHGRRASADSQNLHKQPATASFVLPLNNYYQVQQWTSASETMSDVKIFLKMKVMLQKGLCSSSASATMRRTAWFRDNVFTLMMKVMLIFAKRIMLITEPWLWNNTCKWRGRISVEWRAGQILKFTLNGIVNKAKGKKLSYKQWRQTRVKWCANRVYHNQTHQYLGLILTIWMIIDW